MSSNEPSNHPSWRAEFLSAGDAASLLGISEPRLHELAKTGQVTLTEAPNGEMLVKVFAESSEVSSGLTARLAFVPLRGDTVSSEAAEVAEDRRRLHHRDTPVRFDPHGLDANLFASALTARLKNVAPDAADVSVEGTIVQIAGSCVDVSRIFAEFGATDEERLEIAARSVLGAASDAFAEKTGDPWPAKAGHVPGGFPKVHVETHGGCLRMLYGDLARPTLELDPIRVADMRSAG